MQPTDNSFEPYLKGHRIFNRVLRAVAFGDGFSFHLVTVPDKLTASMIVATMSRYLARNEGRLNAVLHLDMATGRMATLQAFLERKHQKNQVVVLDFSSFKVTREKLEKMFMALNEQRNRIAQSLRTPLVLVLPNRMERNFARWAPDFWSIKENLAVIDQSALPVARFDDSLESVTGQLSSSHEHDGEAHSESVIAIPPDSHDTYFKEPKILRRLMIDSATKSMQLLQNDIYRSKVWMEHALSLAAKLQKLQPESLEAMRDLSVSHNNMGDLLLRLGESRGAKEHYEESLRLRIKLSELQPESLQAMRDLSISHEKMGDCMLEMECFEDSEYFFRRALEISEKLDNLTDDPYFHLSRRNIFAGLERIKVHTG